MNRTWYVVWRSTPAFVASTHTSEPLWVLVGGLLFTGLFSLFVMIAIVRRIDTMEWMAGDRGYLVPIGVFLLSVAGSGWLYSTLQASERDQLRSNLVERAMRMQLVMNLRNHQQDQRRCTGWPDAGAPTTAPTSSPHKARQSRVLAAASAA